NGHIALKRGHAATVVNRPITDEDVVLRRHSCAHPERGQGERAEEFVHDLISANLMPEASQKVIRVIRLSISTQGGRVAITMIRNGFLRACCGIGLSRLLPRIS